MGTSVPLDTLHKAQVPALILPDVEQVTIRQIERNRGEIMVWPASSGAERDDLAMSLAESGTGVGQIIALLYVVMTSQPSVILLSPA